MTNQPTIITKTLSFRISLRIFCAIALLLSVSLGIMFYFSRKVLKEEALQNASQTLEGTVQNMDNILLSVEQAMGNVYVDMLMHLNNPDLMPTYSRRFIESNAYIHSCAIAFAPNYFPDYERYVVYAHRKGDRIVTSLSPANGEPYTEQLWYSVPMSTGRALWTDPLKDDEDVAVTSFCLPIYNYKGQRIGVVAVNVSLDLFSKIVLEAKPSENGYSTLLGRNGSFIVYPDTAKLLHQTVFTQVENGGDPSIREAAEAMVAGETGYKRFKMNGRECYVFYKPFQRVSVPGRTNENLGWSVGVVYPKDDIFGDYNRLIYYVLAIGAVGLVLFFILCRFLTHRQLLPLRILAKKAQRIAEGHYDEVVGPTHRKDEVGQLQEHFRHMQESLSANMSELEQLTTTLKERGEGLRDAYERANKADSMKTVFLHNMTNQMIPPAKIISDSVDELCQLSSSFGEKASVKVYLQADREVETIQHQTKIITELLNDLLNVSSGDEEKGGES